MEGLLPAVKRDLHLRPINSRFLQCLHRLGFSLNTLGLYDRELHLIVTQLLDNSGRNLKPLLQLKDSFTSQLDYLSQHEVNYLGSVVNDMCKLMEGEEEQKAQEENLPTEETKEDVPKEAEEEEDDTGPTITSDMLLKLSMKKGKKGKKGKKDAKPKPPKKQLT